MRITWNPSIAPHDTPEDWNCTRCGQEIPTSVYRDKQGNQICIYCHTQK